MSRTMTPAADDPKTKAKPKEVWSGRMDPDLLDRAKALAYWTPGLTLSALVEVALRSYLETWEKEHGDTPPPDGPLREGRPLIRKSLR